MARPDALSGQETALFDYAQRLSRHVAGRRAVHVHLSRLQAHNRRQYHLRIAANAFDPLLQKFDSRLFQIGNGDIFFVAKDAAVAEIDEFVLKLRYLFSGDPLTTEHEETSIKFCTWYDLERDYADFRTAVEHAARLAELRRREGPSGRARGDGPSATSAPSQPIDPARLGQIEQLVAKVDLRPLVRQQAICAILSDMIPRTVLSEIYVSISELGQRLMPGVDLTADRWLFQRLSHTLDLKLLTFLPTMEEDALAGASININVATLLSSQFLTFDTRFRALTRKAVVFELQPVDVFGDVSAYLFARDFVRERGYRVCLDGLNHLTYPLIQRDQLGFDFEKIVWSPDMAAEVSATRRNQLQQAIAKTGPGRVILCRCDSQDAIAFGHSLGITLFQGRHIDGLVAQGRLVEA